MAMVDALMMAYTVEMISIEKVVASVQRFSTFSASKELPYDLEDAMVFWVNKVSAGGPARNGGERREWPGCSLGVGPLPPESSTLLCVLLRPWPSSGLRSVSTVVQTDRCRRGEQHGPVGSTGVLAVQVNKFVLFLSQAPMCIHGDLNLEGILIKRKMVPS